MALPRSLLPTPAQPSRASRGRTLQTAVLGLVFVVAAFGHAGISPQPASAACGSFQALVNAAPSGGTITVPPCTYHEQVRITKPLTIHAAGVVVDGDNSRDFGVAVLADNVTIDGLTVQHIKSGTHIGAVWSTGVSNFTFRDGVARDSATVCVSLNGGSGHRVLNSELTGCGKEGYFMNGVSDVLFAGNRIHHNNTAFGFDPSVEAGGGKTMASQRVTFDRNDVANNGGPGIWFDSGAVDVSVTNNSVHDNDRAGIFFEIGNGATISGNAVWNNGFGFVAWGYGAGITISSSDRAVVHGNTVAWNARGISVISQSRDLKPHTGNVVHDNVVISRDGAFVAGWYDDHGDTLFGASSGNNGYGNRYWVGAPEPSPGRFEWDGQRASLADYNATPGEQGATYLTLGERDAALATAGIPGIDGTLPEPPPAGALPPGPPPPGTTLVPAIRAAAPLFRFGSGRMAADATLPGRVAWAATPGAVAYQVQIQRDGGAWRSLSLASAGARSAGVTYAPWSRYRARVRVKGSSGAWSPWSYSALVGSARYQETMSVTYSGTWTRATSAGASGAFVRFASRASATATFKFDGRAVTWIAPRGPGRGSARVYVDGVYRTTVNLTRSSTLPRSIVFATSWSTRGTHSVKILVVGTEGHPRIDVDAFAVLR